MKTRRRVITGNAFRICKGLGLTIPLLLAGPVAFATLDVSPTADSNGNIQSIATPSMLAGRNWIVSGTHAQVPDSTMSAIAHTPEIFRELPIQRELDSDDIPSVPEPSTAIAATLLLLPFGVGALRIVRKKQPGGTNRMARSRHMLSQTAVDGPNAVR